MKKIISMALLCTLTFSISLSVLAADYNTQETSIRSSADIKEAKAKEKMAKEVFEASKEYKEKKITKEKYDNIINNYKKTYGNKVSNPNTKLVSANSVAASDIFTLGLNLIRQDTDWYCGPASAYMVLARQGISSYNGRTLSQYNLAYDLGALSAGAIYPGSWQNTMRNWSNGTAYVATWAPDYTLSNWQSNVLTYSYVSTGVGGHGNIYDTVMSGTNQLEGYADYTSRKHYVAGDGYNLTTSEVHYYDPHNLNNNAYGPHWASAELMGTVTYERGMVW